MKSNTLKGSEDMDSKADIDVNRMQVCTGTKFRKHKTNIAKRKKLFILKQRSVIPFINETHGVEQKLQHHEYYVFEFYLKLKGVFRNPKFYDNCFQKLLFPYTFQHCT